MIKIRYFLDCQCGALYPAGKGDLHATAGLLAALRRETAGIPEKENRRRKWQNYRAIKHFKAVRCVLITNIMFIVFAASVSAW